MSAINLPSFPKGPVAVSSGSEVIPTSDFIASPVPLDFYLMSGNLDAGDNPVRDAVSDALGSNANFEALQIAEYHLQQVLLLAPDHHEEIALANGLVAEIYERMGSLKSACAHWLDAAKILEDCPPALEPLRAEVLFEVAGAKIRDGDFFVGAKYCAAAEKLLRSRIPNDLEAVGILIAGLIATGTAYSDIEEYQKAHQTLAKARNLSAQIDGVPPVLQQEALMAVARNLAENGAEELARKGFQDVLLSGGYSLEYSKKAFFYAHVGLARISFAESNDTTGVSMLTCARSLLDSGDRLQCAELAMGTLIAGRRLIQSSAAADAALGATFLAQAIDYSKLSVGIARVVEIGATKALAELAERDGDYEKNEKLLARLLRLSVKEHGESHPETCRARELQIESLENLGRYSEALSVAEINAAAIARRAEAKSPDHVRALLEVAEFARMTQQSDKAGKTLQTARELADLLPKKEFLLRASVYDLSAVDAAGRAQYELAAAHSGYALEIVEESLGAESPSTAERLVSHARALIDIDRPKRALKLAKQALRILNEQTPEDKEGIADVYHCAGLSFHRLHRFDDAERCLNRALRMYKDDCGIDLGYLLMAHDFVTLKADKAEFYDSRPLYEGAYKLACKVLRVSERPEFENRIAMKQILSTSAELAGYLGLTSDQRIYLRKIELLNKKLKAA